MAKSNFSGKARARTSALRRALFTSLVELFQNGIEEGQYQTSRGQNGQYRCSVQRKLDGTLSVYVTAQPLGEGTENLIIFSVRQDKQQAKVVVFEFDKRFYNLRSRTARQAVNVAALGSCICLSKAGYCFRPAK